MYLDGTDKLTYELVTLGNINEVVSWKSDNDGIASVDEIGNVVGKGHGITYVNAITESGISAKTKVIVSSFITKPVVNTSKSYLTCKQFSKEEADMINNERK